MEFLSHSTEETERFAYEFAKKVSAPHIICLTGDLGAGKTAFTRGFARFFGIEKGVNSPTFTIMQQYLGSVVLNHYDLYRLSDYDELCDIGFEEQIEQGITIIEWPDAFIEYLPKEKTVITISRTENDPDERLIRLEGNI